MGVILALCTSKKKGTLKNEVKEVVLIENHGIEGDAHAGKWHRQVSLLSFDKIDEFRKKGANVDFGAFGENLVVEGLDLGNSEIGDLIEFEEVVLEITQKGKKCHDKCAIFYQVGECIMPKNGVFTRVIKGGTLKVNDRCIIKRKTELISFK